MSLSAGTRFGPYEILSALGAGGMGEVWRARDTKLNRDVALKVLPDSFANDPDRLARFTREAQTLASLNHPNIAHIHGLEESPSTSAGQAGVRALVMELVEGEDLSQRITRGAIPLDEALPIAKQIAEALEAAHEQGIIHRDLKPANVKVRPDGTVKVLDFGLAKALDPVGEANVSAMNSPTLTAHGTQMGMILGTAAYMSPEQARGKVADRRADVWAFGVVLYEMLTGRRAFEGEEISDVLAAVLKETPLMSALPGDTPAPIRRLLRRCLEKDRRKRVGDMSAARLEIEDVLAGAPEDIGTIAPSTTAAPIWRRVLPWASTGALAVGLAAVLVLWAPWRTTPPPAPLRVSAELGADASLVIRSIAAAMPQGNPAIISPDGTQLAFVAHPHGGGAPRLYVRRLDQLTATPLAGTEGATGPFFSPDGQWLGFFSGVALKKVAVTGGAPVTLAPVSNARGASWAEDGTIIFAPSTTSGLWRVPEAGGTPEQVTMRAPGQEATHRWPQVLPGGRAVLYTVSPVTGVFTNAWLAVQPLPTGTPRIVQRSAYYGRYLSSERGSSTRAEREGGHLTWVQDGTLFAAPFDLATLAVTGPAVPVLPGVMSHTFSGYAHVEVSRTGTLVYLPGDDNASRAPLAWLTRDGKTTPLRATPANWGGVQIAPGGRRLAFSLTGASGQDVWTYDVARDAPTRLTVDPGSHRTPIWTPNRQRLVYSNAPTAGARNLYWQPADGRGAATRLTTSPNNQSPGSWHKSGAFLAFEESRPPPTGSDLMILPLEGDEASGWKPGTPTVFLDGPSTEQQPRFSPDGRWLAYESNESGGFEISVRPFQRPGGTTTISTGGGSNAVWSRAGNELLYLAPDGRIMVVPYTANGGIFQPGKATVWSETAVQFRSATGASFDLDPDGTRVVMAPASQATAFPTHVTLIFNFFDELRRLAPVTKR